MSDQLTAYTTSVENDNVSNYISISGTFTLSGIYNSDLITSGFIITYSNNITNARVYVVNEPNNSIKNYIYFSKDGNNWQQYYIDIGNIPSGSIVPFYIKCNVPLQICTGEINNFNIVIKVSALVNRADII